MIGIQWSNLFLVADQTYNVSGSVGMIMIFSIIGTVLHFYLTLYIYAVKPGKYGVKKHMLYFLEVKFYFRIFSLIYAKISKYIFPNLISVVSKKQN